MTAELKTIQTEAEYNAALGEAEHLWGAKSGTPESDRLDVLVKMIDAYESLHFPMDSPSPAEAIQFRSEQLGLTKSGS